MPGAISARRLLECSDFSILPKERDADARAVEARGLARDAIAAKASKGSVGLSLSTSRFLLRKVAYVPSVGVPLA